MSDNIPDCIFRSISVYFGLVIFNMVF